LAKSATSQRSINLLFLVHRCFRRVQEGHKLRPFLKGRYVMGAAFLEKLIAVICPKYFELGLQFNRRVVGIYGPTGFGI
jgi:hypothetical protein